MVRPVAPRILGFEEVIERVAIAIAAMVRGIPAHRKRHGLAVRDGKLADRRQFRRAAQRHRRNELYRVRPRNTARAAEMGTHPGYAAPIIKTQDDFGAHPHAALVAAYE